MSEQNSTTSPEAGSRSAQRILITGASGFVGRALCRHLMEAGFRVHGLLRPDSAVPAGLDKVSWREGDLADPDSLDRACREIDVVVHLAAQAQTNERYARETMRVNLDGTRALLSAAEKNGLCRFVFISSVLAGAAGETRTAGSYARSKREAEKLIAETLSPGPATATAPDFVILRPVNVYGPGMRGSLNKLIRGIGSGRLPRLPDLGASLALVGRGDLVRVIEQCLDARAVTGKTYLVSDGLRYSLTEIEEAVYAALGRRMPRWHMPAVILYAAATLADLAGALARRPVGLRQTLARLSESREVSNEDLVRDLGFVPEESFQSALPAILQNLEQTTDRANPG